VTLLGCKRDAHSPHDFKFAKRREDFDRRIGASPVEDTRLLQFAEVREQLGQSCVGESMAQSMGIIARSRGENVRYSGLGMYMLSKIQETTDFLGGEAPDANLRYRDDGTTLRAACKAVGRFGLIEEGDIKSGKWPHEERCLLKTPSRKALDGARKTRGFQYLRIVGSADERAADISRAIRSGFPVCCAIAVDDAIVNWAGPSAIGPPRGILLGYHALTLSGVCSDGSFLAPSTWGAGWANDGIARISSIALTYDIWVLAEGLDQ
jgi:hypothetical protein